MADTKQVIIIRNDLNMRRGKMVAQGAHASLVVITSKLNISQLENEYKGEFVMPKVFKQWLENSYTKICLQCNSEEELIGLYNAAKEQNILCSLIKDNGTTEFNNVPTFTAAAIGPDYSDKIDKITGKLKLF
jgi:peptidyl-tRNA hydrolase, PTH2 family